MQPSFFDVDQRHEEISKMGDPLESNGSLPPPLLQLTTV